MADIDAALARCDADNPVFYEDEVDIDLNPKLGADWMFRAQQKRVVTPGQNAKHYLAGVLHAGNGRVLYVSGIKKNSSLFIAMLEKLRRHYRRAKTITLILDHFARRDLLMRPRFRSDREDWVQRVVADGHAICILPERSPTVQGLVTRPIDGFVLEREVVIATVSGSTATVEIRNIAQLAARYEWN
ncbi:hypothetical protein KAM330_35600 [Aeromonas hydrophila]|nr:hypothetical protein KAM330_35600 [Aeromonas hydrophila]